MTPSRWILVITTLVLSACASTGPTVWTAAEIRQAAPIWEGCWTFSLGDAGLLSDPLSGDTFEFPLGEGVNLTRRETADIWAGFGGVRQPVAFEVEVASRPHLPAYWLPHPPGRRFSLKWRDGSSASNHVTLIVSDTPAGPRGVVSLRGEQIGVVLNPEEVVVTRCSGSLGLTPASASTR